MSYPAKTLLVFGAYLLALATVLLVAPNALLAFFGLAATAEVWIRVVGMLLLFLGAYDVLAARAELRAFFAWSVWLRASVIVFFAAFVGAGLVGPVLLLFGAVDLAFATWTWLALRATRGAGAAPAPGQVPR